MTRERRARPCRAGRSWRQRHDRRGTVVPDELHQRLRSGDQWFVSPSAALGAVSSLLGLAALRDRASTPGARRFLGAATPSAALVAVALGANAYTGFVPNLHAARLVASNLGLVRPTAFEGPEGGRVEPVSIPAPAERNLPRTTTWVYTPPRFDPSDVSRRYPVVYALHGSPGGSSD